MCCEFCVKPKHQFGLKLSTKKGCDWGADPSAVKQGSRAEAPISVAKTQKRWKIIIEACGRLVKSRTWSLKFSTVSAKQGDTLLTHDPYVLP